MNEALWLARMGIIAGGGYLTSKGIGDEGTWEAIAGGAVTVLGAVWSYAARKKQIATVPPGYVPAPAVEAAKAAAASYAQSLGRK